MVDFVYDACNGSGTFSGRSPTVGSVWHSFAYDIPYGNVTSPVDLRLPYLKLDGNGAAKYDSNLSGYYDISLTSAVPTSADYAVEISLMISGLGQTSNNISGSLCGRIRPNGEVKSLTWYIGYQDATNFFVELTYDNWSSDPDAPVGGVPARTYTNVPYGTLVTIRAEYVGREIRSFVNGDLKATLVNGGPYLDAIGKVAWAYRTYGSEFDPAHKIESLRATYNLSTGDLLRAEFNGTGDLTAYAPETGTLAFPIHTMSETGDVSYIDNPTASRFIRNGAGAFQLDMNTGGAFNVLDPVIILTSGDKPSVLNYAVEVEVSIPSHAAAPSLNLYCTVGGRATLDTSNQGWWNFAGLQFNMSQGTGGIFLSVRPMLDGANADASFDEVGSWIALPSLGFNAQTIRVRVEFEGRVIRGFVNNAPVAAYGTITEWTWTPDNGVSSIFDVPGDAGFDAYLQNEANESIGLSATKIERLLITYTLLPKPTAPGQFWNQFVKCTEVDTVGALMLAAPEPEVVVVPKVVLPEPVFVFPPYIYSPPEPILLSPPPVVEARAASLIVNADFVGVDGTKVTDYIDLLGNHFYVPYYLESGYVDINYTLYAGDLSGINPPYWSPGGGDDRNAYANFVTPGADVTVETGIIAASVTSSSMVWLVARSDTRYGNWSGHPTPNVVNRIMARVDFSFSDSYLQLINDVPGGSFAKVTKSIAPVSGMNLKLRVIGNIAKLLVDDVEQLSLPVTVLAPGYAGWSGSTWGNGNFPGDTRLTHFKVYSEDPPSAFWTTRVRCTEVDAIGALMLAAPEPEMVPEVMVVPEPVFVFPFPIPLPDLPSPPRAKLAASLISDDFTVRPGIWIGSAVSVGGLSWVSDREPPGYWDEAVRTSGVGLFNSNPDQNSSGYIPSTLLTNNDCQIDVTYNITAASNYYDSIWVWFNVYPEYVPSFGIQGAYDGSGFSPMCGIRLYPRDTSNNQSEMFFLGQLEDAAGGSSKNTALMPVGVNTIRIYVNGVDVFFYLNGVLLTSTQDTVFFRNWSTVRRFHNHPGVGLQWDNSGGYSGRLMPTAFVVSGTPSAQQFWTSKVKCIEVDS